MQRWRAARMGEERTCLLFATFRGFAKKSQGQIHYVTYKLVLLVVLLVVGRAGGAGGTAATVGEV